MAAGTALTRDEEAGWDAALRAGVHFVDVMKPATALLLMALAVVCSPAVTVACGGPAA